MPMFAAFQMRKLIAPSHKNRRSRFYRKHPRKCASSSYRLIRSTSISFFDFIRQTFRPSRTFATINPPSLTICRHRYHLYNNHTAPAKFPLQTFPVINTLTPLVPGLGRGTNVSINKSTAVRSVSNSSRLNLRNSVEIPIYNSAYANCIPTHERVPRPKATMYRDSCLPEGAFGSLSQREGL